MNRQGGTDAYSEKAQQHHQVGIEMESSRKEEKRKTKTLRQSLRRWTKAGETERENRTEDNGMLLLVASLFIFLFLFTTHI